jgi:hypothetical protein
MIDACPRTATGHDAPANLAESPNPVGSLRRYSWGLQLHVGINRLVLWIRNPQLLCHPHQLRQRPGPHLLHDSPTLNFDGEFGRSQLDGDLLFAYFLQRPVLIVSFGDGAVRINTRNSSPFDGRKPCGQPDTSVPYFTHIRLATQAHPSGNFNTRWS